MLGGSTKTRPLAWVGAALGITGLFVVVFLVGAKHPPEWQHIAPGLEHRLVEARDVQADLLRFDLEKFELSVEVPGPSAPMTVAEAAKTYRATAAINGGFFDPQWRPLGLRVSHGLPKVNFRNHVDWGVFVMKSSRADIVHSRDYHATSADEAAIQVGPRLLVKGNPTKLKPQLAYRSALAIDATGRFVTLVSTAIPVDANVLAQSLYKLREFSGALLLDGGPSAQMFAQAGGLLLERPGGYPVPDVLLMTPRSR